MNKKNLKALLITTKYILLSTLRNPTALFFGFMFPLIFIVIFGLMGNGKLQFGLAVYPDSIKSGPVYESLANFEVFNLITDLDKEQIEMDLSKGRISGALKIVETEDKKFEIKLSTTSADPQGGTTIQNLISNLIFEINKSTSSESSEIVSMQSNNVEGRKYNRIDFILPGQLSFALLSTGVFTIAFSLITLRKTLVLKRMSATPTPRWVILGSKVLSSILIAVLQATLIILVGHFAFGFTLVHGFVTFVSMVLLSILGLVAFLGLGLLVSSLANDEDSAAPIANLITMPQLLLSGSFFSIDAFPDFLQPIARVMPMTFLNDSMRKVAFEGATLSEIAPNLFALTLIGIGIYIIAIRIFKWE